MKRRKRIGFEVRTHPRIQVAHPRNGADGADGQGREQPVALAGQGGELRGLVLRLDPGDLGDAAARQLDADDVGVRPQPRQHLRVDVEAGRHAGEVVDEDRDRAGVSQL